MPLLSAVLSEKCAGRCRRFCRSDSKSGHRIFTGLTSGASVIVSQFLGSRDADRGNESIHTIYAFSVVGSVVVMVLGLLLSPMILEMMNTPPELLEESIIYLRIYFAGIFLCIYL